MKYFEGVDENDTDASVAFQDEIEEAIDEACDSFGLSGSDSLTFFGFTLGWIARERLFKDMEGSLTDVIFNVETQDAGGYTLEDAENVAEAIVGSQWLRNRISERRSTRAIAGFLREIDGGGPILESDMRNARKLIDFLARTPTTYYVITPDTED